MILKLKRTPGLYLVGFMASGKTTIGRSLAEELGWSFADIDEDVETRERISIPEIFESRGEAEFRRLETAAIRERVRNVECGRPIVIVLGGGAFVQQVNFDLLENNGVTVWVDCPLPRIRDRVKNCVHRPLARDPAQLEQLYESRRPAYARADYRIEITDDDPAVAVADILKLPIFR
ncbi:MAG: shikimate kinase [Acidobacteriota bacterium]|nr:shikimate kinase [Acidobacteriota bacterium]